MANALTAGTLQIGASAKISGAKIAPQGTAADVTISSPTASADAALLATFAFGTGSGQCDILCAADYDLAAGASVTIDLYASGLLNVFGGTADFRKLKAVLVQIQSGGDSAGVTVGAAAANAHPLFFGGTTPTWTVYPDQCPLPGASATGVTVDATHRNVKILNNGAAPATVRVVFGGTSV